MGSVLTCRRSPYTLTSRPKRSLVKPSHYRADRKCVLGKPNDLTVWEKSTHVDLRNGSGEPLNRRHRARHKGVFEHESCFTLTRAQTARQTARAAQYTRRCEGNLHLHNAPSQVTATHTSPTTTTACHLGYLVSSLVFLASHLNAFTLL
ncbi:hypothetical protein O3P69_004525 [Scylla paramamosain]|uniref:Uncharacterized protein n=1 Tax=Scylla paramamosain TaxID=85552 RepID=A0AAW0UCC9_SCYPA